jgi:hypothetical protein
MRMLTPKMVRTDMRTVVIIEHVKQAWKRRSQSYYVKKTYMMNINPYDNLGKYPLKYFV